MTKAQALAEARKRWPGGSLLANEHGARMVGFWGPKKQEYVGQFADMGMCEPPLTWHEMGCARNWRDAFADADRRALLQAVKDAGGILGRAK